MNITLPDYAEPYFQPHRFKVMHGGRGSAKSYSTGKILLLKRAMQPGLVLCARELQNSIADSVHRLLSEQVFEMGLEDFYTIKKNYIEGANGSRFLFKGVKHNTNSIKSMQGIDDLWLEEAQTVSKESWDVLTPTIRKPNSEIWVTFNPENEDDPTYEMFLGENGPPPNTLITEANWRDNPWFPEVLRQEKDYLKEVNPDLYMHVWEGECRSNSDAQVFKDKYEIKDFEVQPHWDGPYFGADWGFSIDPTVLVKIWIDTRERKLYIEHETGAPKIEIPDIAKWFDKIPDSRKHLIKADCARPEIISHVASQGFAIEGANKWPGSVEEGTIFLQSFRKIICHSRCTGTAEELRKHKYKTDRLTGAITAKLDDSYNHRIDAIRYALEYFIKRNKMGLFSVL